MSTRISPATIDLLERCAIEYERASYIQYDPIAIPHGFSDPRDVETIGLFSALLAWGRRSTTLSKMEELCERMAFKPYQFVSEYSSDCSDKLIGFKHRTFTEGDAHFLCRNLRTLFEQHTSLSKFIEAHVGVSDVTIENGIQQLSSFLSTRDDTPDRLSKHLSQPSKGSACKRLCMYFRWMTRPGPFDLGIWSFVRLDQLVLPLDVHTGRQARHLGLLSRKSNDWTAALELTSTCRDLDPTDPTRIDFALFGLGAYGIPVQHQGVN